jgi:diacylglycerol kinase family enzyme
MVIRKVIRSNRCIVSAFVATILINHLSSSSNGYISIASNKSMNKTSRRTFLMCGLIGGQAALMAGCGGGAGSSAAKQAADTSQEEAQALAQALAASRPPMRPPARPPAQSRTEWPSQETLAVVVGSPTTVDLKQMLPSGSVRGGRFELDSSGSPLPSGVTLTPDGLLSANSASQTGVIYGVVFAYILP